MNNKKMLGNLLLLLTAMIWGTAFVFQRVGMDSIEPITFNAARMALAAVMVGALAFGLRQRHSKGVPRQSDAGASAPGTEVNVTRQAEESDLPWSHTWKGGICCGLFLTAGSVFQQMGVVYTTAGKAGFITAMYMLLVPILNFLLFKKKNSWLVWLAVFLGVGGMYLLCVKEDFTLTRGDILVCICALMFSGHILCCDYFVKLASAVELAAIQFATAAVVSAVIAAFTENPDRAGIVAAAVPILYCGVVSGGIGYTLQIVAQKFTDPTIASLLMSLESVFAVIAGSVLLGEQMSSRELLGCAVMFAATVLVQIPLPGERKA
ncbi:MAG: DMT family transporter [Acidaminococcaceae bacterium]|jgi:drug/metabolite transporter (DMT)-like permease|nr:DMT family transporter [Acidaminococcaceae bacterium]